MISRGHGPSWQQDAAAAFMPLLRLASRVPVPDLGSPSDASIFLGSQMPTDFPWAYRLIPTVFFAVSLIQEKMASLPLRFYQGEDDNAVEIKREKANIVDLWSSANSQETGYDLIEQIVGSLKINGNAYLFKDYMGTDKVQEFWCLPGSIVTPIPGPRRTTLRFDVRTSLGQTIPVPPEQIVHIRMYDPEHGIGRKGLLGLSPLQVLQLAYETQRDAGRWMRTFYGKGGTVAGHYKTDTTVDAGDIERLKRDIRRRFQGLENAWEPVILPRKLEYVRAGLTLAEMQFIENNKLTESQILQVYKVPPMLAGRSEGSGLNSDVARVARSLFIDLCIRPLCERIQAYLDEKLLPEFGAGITCEFDLDGDPSVQEARLSQAEMYGKVVGGPILSRREARIEFNMPDQVDGELLVSSAMVPDSSLSDPATFTPQPEPAPATQPPAQDPNAPPKAESRDERTDALRKRNDRLLSVYERRVQAAYKRMFTRQEKLVVARLAQLWPLAAEVPEVRALERIVNIASLFSHPDDLDRDLIRRLMRAILEGKGAEELAALGLEVAYDINAAEVVAFLQQHVERAITLPNDVTKEMLREQIMEGMGEGEGLDEITARVRGVFGDRRDNAITIARTETAPAFNFASMSAWDQSGVVESKQWLTAGDEAVRDWHREAEAQVRPLDEPFNVGPDELDFPGDPEGEAGNVINCRCTMLPVVAERLARDRGIPSSILQRIKSRVTVRPESVEEFLQNGHARK